MSKVAVVFWSSSGNTETMAEAVLEGAKGAGADAEMINCADFNADMVDQYDGIALGCPAMGDEVLEEDEFEPLYDACKSKLAGKKVALFGSYGWGDGEWMRNWEEDAKEYYGRYFRVEVSAVFFYTLHLFFIQNSNRVQDT